MGWALDNLGQARCQEIAEGLFHVEKIYGDKVNGFCPIHGDKKSASFFYNSARDSYSCSSCGVKGDLVKLWCLVNGHDGQDLKAFREENDDNSNAPGASRASKPRPARVEPPRAPDVFILEEVLAALPPLPADAVTEIMQKRSWSREVIECLDLREFIDIKGKHRIAIPIRDDEGRLGNIRLYMPGAESFKLISWFDQVCPHCGGKLAMVAKKKQCKECGKAPNDYGRTRLFPPPTQWKPGLLWLCEGEPDVICALSHGLNACTQTAGCGSWTEEFSRAMAGRDVVICYDADGAGYKGAMTAAAPSIAQHAKSVRVMIWPESMASE